MTATIRWKKRFEAFWSAAVTIRFRPLLIAVLLFSCSALMLFFGSDDWIRFLPKDAMRDWDSLACWRVLSQKAEPATGKPRVYVLGGSQVMFGFPEQGVPSSTLDVWTCGTSAPTLMDSFLILTHLPVDGKTYVFMHITPSRMSKTALAVPLRLGFLYSEALVQAFGSQAIVPGPGDLTRWSRQFKTFLMFLPHRLDWFGAEHWFKRDPAGFVAAAGIEPQGGNREESLSGELVDPNLILKAMKQYVESRGGHLYLIEMPYYLAFPDGMPGWQPQDQPDPKVREWLEEMLRTRNYASALLNESYYQMVKESGIPLISFMDRAGYGPGDFFDSMHLMESGRAKFIPRFLQAVEREVERGGNAFQ